MGHESRHMSGLDSAVPRSQNDILEGPPALVRCVRSMRPFSVDAACQFGVLTRMPKQCMFDAPVCPTGASWWTEKIPSVCSHRPQIKASEPRSFREESAMLTRLGSKQQNQAPRRFKVPQSSPLVLSRWPLARSGHALLCSLVQWRLLSD